MTIADLYPYLILVGSSIILAAVWLLAQARMRARISNELVSLNESLAFDLPDFLRNCWEQLAKAGFQGIDWQLNWFGTEISHSEGERGEVIIERELVVQDITLRVHLYDSKRRFEQRYFSALVAESFFLLLYTDMWMKLGTVQGAFTQAAKMSVFLQHDMKNVVQLISLLAEQLENSKAEEEAKLLDSVKVVIPTLQERSESFLRSLSQQHAAEEKRPISVASAIERAAQIHNLEIELAGDGLVAINEQSLNSICDNLFGNYVDERVSYPNDPFQLQISINETGNELEIAISDVCGRPCINPERLFEPFWSAKGSSGLGIGLYQARQLVGAGGGTLTASAEADKPVKFVIKLPKFGEM